MAFSFTRHDHLVLGIWVDDMPVFFKDEGDKNWFIEEISKKYEIKYGKLEFLLGIEIIRNCGSILIRQKSYIERKASQFGVQDAKSVQTPMVINENFGTEENPKGICHIGN